MLYPAELRVRRMHLGAQWRSGQSAVAGGVAGAAFRTVDASPRAAPLLTFSWTGLAGSLALAAA